MIQKTISSHNFQYTFQHSIIQGYASVFNNLDSNRDIILPQAFSSSNDLSICIPFLLDHNISNIMGEVYYMYEDDYGLYIRAKIYESYPKREDLFHTVKIGSLSSFSIGFKTLDHYYDKYNGVRYIKTLKLYEVSLVKIPSNSHTKASVHDFYTE